MVTATGPAPEIVKAIASDPAAWVEWRATIVLLAALIVVYRLSSKWIDARKLDPREAIEAMVESTVNGRYSSLESKQEESSLEAAQVARELQDTRRLAEDNQRRIGALETAVNER